MPVSWPWNSSPCLRGPFPGFHTAEKFLIVNQSLLVPFIIILVTEGINAPRRNSPVSSPPTFDVFPSRHFSVPSLYKSGIKPHIILCTAFFLLNVG